MFFLFMPYLHVAKVTLNDRLAPPSLENPGSATGLSSLDIMQSMEKCSVKTNAAPSNYTEEAEGSSSMTGLQLCFYCHVKIPFISPCSKIDDHVVGCWN